MQKQSQLPRFHQRMENKEPITVVTYGDSWTYGSVATGWAEARAAGNNCELITGSWALQLRGLLKQSNPNAVLFNEGVPGWTSLQGLEAFDQKVSSRRPNLVILNFGINDWRKNISLDEYSAAMEQMMNKIKGLGSECLVWTSGPISIQSEEHYGFKEPLQDEGFPNRFIQFMERLQQLAEQHELPLVDAGNHIHQLWENGTNITSWFYDSFHFTQEGHDEILRCIVNGLQLD